MNNVLVTGGAGFIGSNFVRLLLASDKNVQVFNLDALTYAGSNENLMNLPSEKRHVFIRGDICNLDMILNILRQNQIDTIVHFAAETHVDRSILGPAQFIQTNIVGTFQLLEAARKVWLEEKLLGEQKVRFHHVSTDEVFGTLMHGEAAWEETRPYLPNSPYSASKASSDHLVRAYAHTYHLPITISNCSNNYGPYQFPEKFIPLIILNAIGGKKIPVYGDGQQIRDWLYVEDHCEAILKIILHGKDGETYNIGGNNQPTNLEIVNQICSIMDEVNRTSPFCPHQNLIQFVTDRPGHDRRYAMDIRKIKRELNWSPSVNLEEGLVKTVNWYFSNPEWVEAIQTRKDYGTWMQVNYSNRDDKKPGNN
jgi:dTDP-glucose 4,6-dehydratase